MPDDLNAMLNRFGFGGNYRRVTLGKGAVGKSTSGFLGLCGVFGIIAAGLAWAGNPGYLIALGIIIAALFTYYQYSIMGFARKNPGAALLEGADLVKWHQAEIAAKDLISIPNTPPVPDPQNPIQVEKLSNE